MKELLIYLSIIFIHWLADFVFQTDEMARGKSKNFSDLVYHTTVYSLVWLITIPIITYFDNIEQYTVKYILFVAITFLIHTFTDYFTSRINAKLWEQKKVHNFFVSVGFDQFLHYLQLFLTYYFLFKF